MRAQLVLLAAVNIAQQAQVVDMETKEKFGDLTCVANENKMF